MAQDTAAYPATKIYVDGAGHTRELHYSQSRHSGEWFPVYALSQCTDECRACGNGDTLEEYAGEYEYED